MRVIFSFTTALILVILAITILPPGNTPIPLVLPPNESSDQSIANRSMDDIESLFVRPNYTTLKAPAEYELGEGVYVSADFRAEFGGSFVTITPKYKNGTWNTNAIKHRLNYIEENGTSLWVDWQFQYIFYSEEELLDWYINTTGYPSAGISGQDYKSSESIPGEIYLDKEGTSRYKDEPIPWMVSESGTILYYIDRPVTEDIENDL